MVSDGVLVIPGYNLHYAEKHTVCWQHWREGGRIGEEEEEEEGGGGGGGWGGDLTTYFFFSSRCRCVSYLRRNLPEAIGGGEMERGK